MQATYSAYDHLKSIDRIDELLKGIDASYEDTKGIPSRDRLTFSNGFYVDVTVLFIDMRGSKALAERHTRPVLAKIYRAYISELVAVLRGNSKIFEIYIEGDGIWAVFDTQTKSDVDEAFSSAYMSASLIDTLNIKLKRKGYSELIVGIGLTDGEALVIKAGYNGSGINEVVWLGKVVGEAAKLCDHGNRTITDRGIMVSEVVYKNLNDHNKGLLEWSSDRGCYHGDVIQVGMNRWVLENA